MSLDATRNRVVIDANILVGAVMGRSFPLIADLARRATIFVPMAQVDEARRIVQKQDARALDVLHDLLDIMTYVNPANLEQMESRAQQRLHRRAQPEGPVLAAALALDADIWSRDRDLFGVGVPVWETRNSRYAARESAEEEYDA